jgi:hypothetical protein
MRNSAIFAALLLVGCGSAPASSPPETEAVRYQWTRLADGSSLRTAQRPLRTVERCRPLGQAFDCITYQGGNVSATITRQVRARLDMEPPNRFVGYVCTHRPRGIQDEKIVRNEAELVGNAFRVSDGDYPAWRQDYVETYMTDKNVPAERIWFSCHDAARLIGAGGPDALGTPAGGSLFARPGLEPVVARAPA